MLNAKVIVYDEIVRRKLLAAAPRILAENRAMVSEMLEFVKLEVEHGTPTGPGHFGYHGRDTLKIDASSRGTRTSGKLRAAAQLYWREFGTLGSFKGPKGSELRSFTAAIGGFGSGGERPRMLAHHALAGVRKYIKFYYGKSQWWKL